MYVDRSFRGNPTKKKVIDELSFKNCLRSRRKKTSKFFVGITEKNKVYYLS